MLKRLEILGVLAVCLFAIVIVIGGCGGDEDDSDELPPTSDLTSGTGEDLAGLVDLAGLYEVSYATYEGVLSLFGNNTANIWYHTKVNVEIIENSGSWTADRTHLTLLGVRYRYSLAWDVNSGTLLHLTIHDMPTPDGQEDVPWRLVSDW